MTANIPNAISGIPVALMQAWKQDAVTGHQVVHIRVGMSDIATNQQETRKDADCIETAVERPCDSMGHSPIWASLGFTSTRLLWCWQPSHASHLSSRSRSGQAVHLLLRVHLFCYCRTSLIAL